MIPRVALKVGGARSALLIEQAYEEERLACPAIDEASAPTRLLYPRSFVTATSRLARVKTYDYSFMGTVYRRETYPNRKWILEYAARRFTERSYFLATDADERHTPIGGFDRTHVEADVFVPKLVAPDRRGFFHDRYFEVLAASQFTLCPAGDAPWSMRFFEAIMCRSIPIVADPAHAGRNDVERAIGYTFFLPDEDHVFDEAIVERNFDAFVGHQTLLTTPAHAEVEAR